MKTLILFKKCIVVSIALFSGLLFSQKQQVESFNVSDDVLVTVNTSHTNVVFETWNKNKVEVVAVVDGEDLSEKEKEEILKSWDFNVMGNSKKVVITSNAGNMWMGLEGLSGLHGLKKLAHLKTLGKMPVIDIPEMNFDFSIPDIPDYGHFPNWPFGDERPSIKDKDGYMNYNFNNHGAYTFNKNEYRKDKQAYVNKLNKKYNANASVADVDEWLGEVDEWGEEFSKLMEEWGEQFGKEFGEKFGSDFEQKMEKWGEEYGKEMENWGEQFGEEFGKEMEKWGEEFGKDMEKWAQQFENDAEKWADEYERSGGNYSKQVITDPHGNKTIIIKGDNNGDYKKVKATKTIIIRMPKNARTEINVRHGEIKMADAYNIKATLNYSPFTANSIDGGNTLINASYAPVVVNNWNDGVLLVKYIDKCKINNVRRIDLESNSSNVEINLITDVATLSGSFGDIKINKVSDGFNTIHLDLDNTDAFIAVPNAAFTFYFNGKRSTLLYPQSLQLNQKKENGRVLINGFNKNNSSNKSFTINAVYSNVKLQ